MDTQTTLLQTIDTTTQSILEAVGGEADTTTITPKDANTALLQNIASTTESILEAVEAGGGGGESDNYLTTDGEQTVSNKTLDSTNTFPSTLVDTSSAQTITNKTLDSTNTFPSTLVDTSSAQILSGKELTDAMFTSNQIRSIYGTKITLPSLKSTLATTTLSETFKNKSLDSTNKLSSGTLKSKSNYVLTFPDTTATLATTADIPSVVSYQLWDFTSLLNPDFTNCWLFGQHYPDKQVLILFGQVETNYSAQTKTLLDAGVLYSDGATSSRFFIHTTPAVYITLPNSSSSALTIHNDEQLEGSFTFFTVARGSSYTIDSTVATQLI